MAIRSVSPVPGVLAQARKQRGWLQADIAKRAKCSIRRVSDAEAGRAVSPQLLKRMASATGIPYELLLRKEGKVAVTDLLPPRPLLVVGRDIEIRQLIDRYKSSVDLKSGVVQAITAVRGWPGVGKTTLAAELLYQPDMNKIFPDGILWTSLGPSPDIQRLLQQWSRAVGGSTVESANIDELSQRLAGRLAHRRTLLVVDDVWEAIHARPFQIGGAQCGILFTTRFPSVAENLTPTPAHRYLLDVLNDEEAIELLDHLSPRSVQASRSASLELVQAVEGLPLAIQVAGRLLEAEARYAPSAQKDAAQVEKLIRDIRDGAKNILKETAPTDMSDLRAQTTPTVVALLRKSTDLLSEDNRERFAFLGAFAPKPARFRLVDMATVWKVAEEEALTTVRVLADHGLLEPLDNGMYWMHALLVAFAQSLCKE